MNNITKAKVNRKGYLEATYTDDLGNEISVKGSHEVHPDLRCALNALVPFLADLTEMREAETFDWAAPGSDENRQLMRNIAVTGVSRADEEYAMSGIRTLETGGAINVNSPSIDPYESQWGASMMFKNEADAFFVEVEAYLFHGKYCKRQREFDFEPGKGIKDDPFARPAPTADVEPIVADAL